MSENDNTKQVVPQSLTLEPLGYLANLPLSDDPSEPRQLETYASDLTTNIIKDANQAASRNPNATFDNTEMDNTNELNLLQTSKQIPSENTTTVLDKSEYSTSNGIHDDNDFDDDDIQKKMNGVIHDIQSRSVNDTNISRKSIASNHLHNDQVNNSTPTIIDPSTQMDPISNNPTEGPRRSMSDSTLVDHHISTEQVLPLPIRQDESISDPDDIFGIKADRTNTTVPIDDSIDQYRSEQENHVNNRSDDNDDFYNTKTATIDDDQRPSSAIKQNVLDETTRFGTASSSRAQSTSSKQSVRVAPDEPSTSGDEKRTQMSPSKLPDDVGNDTDRDNQEVANISRRPSRALSPLNRPRSPTPNDSRKVSISNEPPPSSSFLAEQSQSTTHLKKDDDTDQSPVISDDNQQNEEQQKQSFESPTVIISPASRRESTIKTDQQQTSRPTSAIKTKFDDNSSEPSTSRSDSSHTNHFIATDEQSKLVKLGEQLQIPTNDLDNGQSNSPSSLSTDTTALVLANPLLDSSLIENKQNHSRPPSETNRKSPTTSMTSNEKVTDGDVLPSKSRRESNISQQQTSITDQKSASRRGSQLSEQTPQISSSRRESSSQQKDELDSHQEQQVASRRTSNVSQEPTSQQESFVLEQQTSSRRESTTLEQKPASRRESTVTEQQPSSKRASIASEQQKSSRQGSVTDEQKTTNRKGSAVFEQQTQSRRGSVADEQKTSSRRGSTASEHETSNRKGSAAFEQQVSHRRESLIPEQQVLGKRDSVIPEQQVSSRRDSLIPEQHVSNRRESLIPEQQVLGKRDSVIPEQQISSRRESTNNEQKIASRKSSSTSEQKIASRKSSSTSEQQIASRKSSSTSEQQVSSRRESHVPEQQASSRRESTNNEQKIASRKSSSASEQQVSNRRESLIPGQQISNRRESLIPEQQVSNRRESLIPGQQVSNRRESLIPEQQVFSRRESHVPEQQEIVSRRESQQQIPSSRRTSTNRDIQSSSPRRPSNVHSSSSKESSRRNSIMKQEQQPIIPVLANKDGRRSSLNIIDTNHQQIKHETHSSYKQIPTSDTDDVSAQTSAKHKQEHTSSIDKRKKSSSTVDENDNRRLSFQRRSVHESKQNSNLITDETLVTPIIMDSSKARQHNGKRTSAKDSSYEQTPTSKLPPVNSSFQQEKPRRSDTLNKQQIPTSNRSETKHLSSSHATTPSEDDQRTHWIKQVIIPSIHLSDSSSREDQPRPQSPNVEQIAERNQPPSPVTKTLTIKNRNAAEQDGQKRKEQYRLSRRSTSADSITHIPLVDDKSLDSTSEINTDFNRHKRLQIKPKKKNVQTNTDQTFDFHQQQRSFFDEKELSPQKPLKATKPMSDHLHSSRRRTLTKEQILTTPDSLPDTDTTTVRRTNKQKKDSKQDKDPVQVNITVVVKKFAGTTKDEPSHTTAEATVDQKPQQYFEPVQRPPESLPPASTAENKEKSDESIERPTSYEQQRTKSSEQKLIEHADRYTQSDTEQIITDQQKKRRRPKRISRTCQTYEHIFRRMEREQHQELRATSDTEKNIQTRKSQLQPRKKSPKKNFPAYLSTDSFRLEDVLPTQYHQSRRNISKSSSMARSLSPQGGKLLILRPTLPFHHTDAVNVQRVCLQYAIDLVPNENLQSGTTATHRNKLTVLKQPEQTNTLPVISTSSFGANVPTNKSITKDKSASYKSEDYTHQRKNGGAF